jgi:hypothetical protein
MSDIRLDYKNHHNREDKMSFIYLVERTLDCDGKGWAFWRFDIEPSVNVAYSEAVFAWERARAVAFNDFMDVLAFPEGERSHAVNRGMFDVTAHNDDEVRAAWQVMARRLEWVSEEIAKEGDKYGSRVSVDECDVLGEREFRSRYLPLIEAADANNGDTLHADYLASNGYTSIFNGR